MRLKFILFMQAIRGSLRLSSIMCGLRQGWFDNDARAAQKDHRTESVVIVKAVGAVGDHANAVVHAFAGVPSGDVEPLTRLTHRRIHGE